MNTELEIQEIIKKNLPAQVGEVLKQRLEQADLDAKKIISLNKTIEGQNEIIRDRDKRLSEYAFCDSRNENLDKRKMDLDKREHDLDLLLLKNQLESEKDKSEFAKSVALGLVRNVEYRRSLYDNISEPHMDSYGNLINMNKSQSSTEENIAK